jgi:hypothetical protein
MEGDTAMKKLAINMVTTLCNPTAIDNIAELREQLQRANVRIQDLTTRLHAIVHVAHDQQLGFGHIIDAHEKNDYESIRSILEAMSARRVIYAASSKNTH